MPLTAVHAVELFGPWVSLPLPGGSRVLASADFNLDGIEDLAVGHNWVVAILLGDGLGGFSRGPVVLESSAYDLVAADFNRDGRPDLALIKILDDVVLVLRGDGSGQFHDPVEFPVGGVTADIAKGDIDGDGLVDLAVALDRNDAVQVLFGDESGGFQAGAAVTVGNQPGALATADLDLDGRSELIVANRLDDSLSLLSIGDGGNVTPYETLPADLRPLDVAVADLDNDGHEDVVVSGPVISTPGEGCVNVLLGDGQGRLKPARKYPLGSIPRRISVADRDGDGNPDLVVADFGSDVMHLLRGDGTGHFVLERELDPGGQPQDVMAGDYDGDGDLDLAVLEADRLVLLPGNGLGGLETAPELETGDRSGCMVDADFDADGAPDLAVLEREPEVVRVLLGDGKGDLELETAIEVPAATCLSAADLDGDAAVDLALVHGDTDEAGVLWGDGQGGFSAEERFAVGDGPGEIVSADFDSDGIADLAVLNRWSDTVSILRGDGARGFRLFRTLRTCPRDACTPYSLLTADFDRNGTADLAVTNTNNFLTLSLYHGDGDGGFAGPLEQLLPYHGIVDWTHCSTGFALADFDADGRSDLALAHHCAFNPVIHHVAILLGDETGGFLLHDDFATQPGPESPVTGDFNRDGMIDLAVGYSTGFAVGLLLGDDRGGFVEPPLTAVPAEPYSLVAADFDLDGARDLVVGSYRGSSAFGSSGAPARVLFNRLFARADVNGSNRIDGFDVAALSRLSGTGEGDPAYRRGADVDLNRIIDGDDLAIAAERFGELVAPVSILRGALEGGVSAMPRTVTLQPGETEGDLITVRVHVQDVDLPAAAARFAVTFGPAEEKGDAILEWVGYRPGDYFTGGITELYEVESVAPDRVEVAVSRLPQEGRVVAGARTLVELVFRVRKPGVARLAFAARGGDPVPALLDADSTALAQVDFFGPLTVTVAATLEGPTGQKLGVSPESLDFGPVSPGTTARRQVRLSNIGFSDLEIRDVSVADPAAGFATWFTAPFTIPPQGYVLLTVTFRPETPGHRSTELRIDSDDPDRPHHVTLHGETGPAKTLDRRTGKGG